MDSFSIAGKIFSSRLIVGTGKYSSPAVMVQAHEASGAEMITAAVRRVNISDRTKESLLDYIDTSKYVLLPNTAGCYTADEAVRTARLGREAGLSNWVKLEVIGDERTLFPDNEQLLEATRILVREGFVVLPYTSDDPIVCRKLEEAGAAAIMPLGAPIGSGLGIQNVNNLRIIREFARVPLIVDAGVGTASDASLAMELGADAVLMNTAIAGAQDPVAMAEAMKLAVRAGRLAYLSGRIPRKLYANAPVARATRESIDTPLTVLRDTIAELVRFQSLLVNFLQQITPYVDTRDRDVAGLLRGLSGAINGVADEAMKRSEALLARERRHDMRIADLEAKVATLQEQLAAAQQAVEKARGG